jgi:hypothetical protein
LATVKLPEKLFFICFVHLSHPKSTLIFAFIVKQPYHIFPLARANHVSFREAKVGTSIFVKVAKMELILKTRA